jgi:hypothetical protein
MINCDGEVQTCAYGFAVASIEAPLNVGADGCTRPPQLITSFKQLFTAFTTHITQSTRQHTINTQAIMKTAAAFVTALALFALVAVDGRVLDEQAGETRLAPEFKDPFGADTFA